MVTLLALYAEAQVTGGSFGGQRWGSGAPTRTSRQSVQAPIATEPSPHREHTTPEPDPFRDQHTLRREGATTSSEVSDVKPLPQWFRTTVLVILGLGALYTVVWIARLFYEFW